MVLQRPTTCPTPEKKQFRSKAEAKKFHRQFQSSFKTRQWPYECDVGDHWHLTTSPPEEQRRIKRQIDAHMGRLQNWQQT